MDIEIRRADISQLETLIKWRIIVLSEVFSIPQNQLPQDIIENNRLYYEKEIISEGNVSCFAYHKGEIIGCGAICIYDEMPSPDNPNGKCAYLMNIYTVPEFRKHGVGDKVINWLIKFAQKKNIQKIFLEATEAGKPLYEKIGFEQMSGMMKFNSK